MNRIFVITVTSLLLFILSCADLKASGKAKVLKFRPEKLAGFSSKAAIEEKSRDPFNWSQDFLNMNIPVDELAIISHFEGLVLKGVMWDEENPVAIINDQMVKAGDVINTVTVESIEKDRVILEKSDHKFTLEFATSFYDFLK